MEELFSVYATKAMKGNDEFKMFSEFFKDSKYVEEWVDRCMQKLMGKNDDKANELKSRGTKLYAKKQFMESLKLYTKALCMATFENEVYGLILANRSAVFYMMEDYKNCLKDINFCLDCAKTAENIHMKVHIRKIKCCSKLSLQNELSCAVKNAMKFVDKGMEIIDKDKIMEDILRYSMEKFADQKPKRDFSERMPELKDGGNDRFLNASSAVCLQYDEQRGRHVTANKVIEPGDVLFVEKPLIFAPIFVNEHMELPFAKCYHCLGTALSSIPCKYCIQCMFCNELCRDCSWNELHKWECRGMQAGLWYHVGIAFPALRALIKGIPSGFCTLKFGNEYDNYLDFHKLVSNIDKMENVLPLIISATVVTVYLKKKTGFFNWLVQQPGFEQKNVNGELVELVGGFVTRHIAQLQCNSSTVMHRAGEDCVPVACAIYPSVSMMNHSCKPNITLHYVRDVVIVEAAERIGANEEICNCYGIDYRADDWESRQEQCRSLYYFECRCRVCRLPA